MASELKKVRTFMLPRFGDQILGALTWASRQRRIVVKACGSSQRDRFIPQINVFGDQADEDDQKGRIDDFVGKLHAYFVSFTTDAPNWIARNAGEGNGLGGLGTTAWRVRPHVVHATRGDPSAGSESSAMPAS